MTQIIITKQLETEIRQFLDNYWALYLEGDLQTWSTFLTDDYKNIGGTEEEIWNSKQEIMDYSTAIMGQMVGVASLRNKKTEVFSLTPYVLAHEFADMYIKIENSWVFYGKFRLSSIIQKSTKGWQVVHQHGSYPDSKAGQGETFAFDKISAENRELKDAVKRRTVELENKNRELEIEAALEKVRSSALAMNEPADMVEVCRVISNQLILLGVTDIRNVQTAIINEQKGTYLNCQYFAAYKEGVIEETDYNLHPTSFAMVQEMKKSAHTTFSGSMEGLELNTFREWRKQYNQFPDPLLDEVDSIHYYFYSIGQGGLGLSTYKSLSEEGLEIFKRFHNVFTLAYRRFIDIELAFTQAREAQIEAAVERVRAQSMAMYQTTDLHKVNEEVLNQLYKLKVDGLTGVSIYLVDEYDTVTIWDLSSPGNMSIPNSYSIKYDAKKYPVMGEWVEIWKTTHEDYFVLDAPKEKLIKAVEEFKEIHPEMAIKFKNAIESGSLIHQWNPVGRLSDGVLSIDLMNPPSEDTKTIVIKMAGAFNMAYQRFLDLQKAEAQTREAQIEAALERVRARSLAMHKTDELQRVIQTVHQELLNLNISISGGSFIAINSEIETEIHCWGSGGTADTSEQVHIPYFDKPFYTNLIKGIKTGPGFFTEEYTQKEKEEFFKFLFKHEPWSKLDSKQKNETLSSPGGYTRSCCVSQHSSIFIINHFGEKFSEADNDILKRFARVFEQTYTRFLDLQKAEAQAREAQIELSLERIRSHVTAMQESSELLDIVVMMRNEFVTLGHEAHYFWHMRWLPEKYEKAMTSGDGTRIGMVMTLPRHIHGDIQTVADWEKSDNPTFVLAMDAENAVDYVHKMISLGDFEIVDHNAPTLDDIRHIGGLTFVMARTTHGEIGFSLPGDVPNPPAAAVDALARFAGVFDLAYKRFEDLKTAEKDLIEIKAAKQNAEEALLELKATQSQLIQSEKMASLGELTAGIAHEIQNPLNFVNNFSEVNTELIDELSEEVDKGNLDEVKAIARDIKENEQKINHHGKRADAIVKGMLQHSRSSSGVKEPTDINALTDEYLRLAYHGLRAKDKSFNASMKTNFDPTIGNINVIPQDMGRVILNLITNAFYAVDEKKKMQTLEGFEYYEPTVSVSTKLIIPPSGKATGVEISVNDNGSGIPKNVLDKIFQPFFTTKPTGQGTGLGLSMSYDIVKAHGGELKVETKEGEGTSFTIFLAI